MTALRSRGISPGLMSPSLRVVRVSATYRSARPRGPDQPRISLRRLTPFQQAGLESAWSKSRTAQDRGRVRGLLLYIMYIIGVRVERLAQPGWGPLRELTKI